MDERDGFYFHRSFREAIDQLPQKDQLALYKAITKFGLDGVEPEKLTPTQNAFYLLVRPVLAKGRTKAANGKQGGSRRKQTASKTEANSKQTISKNESASVLLLSDNNSDSESDKGLGSNSYELRQGTRDEGLAGARDLAEMFSAFWGSYPCNIGKDMAWDVWQTMNPSESVAQKVMQGLDCWKQSRQWAEGGGRFIPRAAKFLADGYWMNPPAIAAEGIPKGASGQLGEAEMEAIQRMLSQEVPDGELSESL